MVKPDLRDDAKFARMIAWLKARGLQAHTTAREPLIIRKRQPRRSRLTGEPR